MSTDSSQSGRSSSNSSVTSADTVTRNQVCIGTLTQQQQNGTLFVAAADPSQSPTTQMYYQYFRRQTPEEDYLSTQQGIGILVQQRQQLVDQLTQHYRKLYRSNEIENLLKFSQQIDSIMR